MDTSHDGHSEKTGNKAAVIKETTAVFIDNFHFIDWSKVTSDHKNQQEAILAETKEVPDEKTYSLYNDPHSLFSLQTISPAKKIEEIAQQPTNRKPGCVIQ